MRKVALILGLALVLAPAFALADTIHQSMEDFYSNGGTHVRGCEGVGCSGPTFDIGDATGTLLREVSEKVFYYGETNLEPGQVANTTVFTYTVYNDAMPGGVPITEFDVIDNGLAPVSISTGPAGWDSEVDSLGFSWWADYPSDGIIVGDSKDSMRVTFSGYVPVKFSSAYAETGAEWSDTWPTGCSGETPCENYNWVASAPNPVPEPGTLTLLGTGLIGVAGLLRRKLKS